MRLANKGRNFRNFQAGPAGGQRSAWFAVVAALRQPDDQVPFVAHPPAVFWLWHVPYNIAIKGSFVALLLVRSRRANIILLAALTLLFLVPYWQFRAITTAISHADGYCDFPVLQPPVCGLCSPELSNIGP